MKRNRLVSRLFMMILTASLVIFASIQLPVQAQNPESETTDSSRTIRTANWVYEQWPEFPRENNYQFISGESAEFNTLVYRLMFYHTRIKRRAPIFRFDWLLTLGDYLGAHEEIVADIYPNATTFTEHPLERDRAILHQLSRGERQRLVDLLVLAFDGELPVPPDAQPTPPSEPTETLPPIETKPLPPAPQPGDADVLR